MYDSYFSTDGAMETFKTSLPAALKCLNPLCSAYSNEYVVWTMEKRNGPECRMQGSWIRGIKGKQAISHRCGMCLGIIWLSENQWPVGHCGWGILQLGNKVQAKFICPACQVKLTTTFKNLKEEIIQVTSEEELPKIIQPSKLIQDG